MFLLTIVFNYSSLTLFTQNMIIFFIWLVEISSSKNRRSLAWVLDNIIFLYLHQEIILDTSKGITKCLSKNRLKSRLNSIVTHFIHFFVHEINSLVSLKLLLYLCGQTPTLFKSNSQPKPPPICLQLASLYIHVHLSQAGFYY